MTNKTPFLWLLLIPFFTVNLSLNNRRNSNSSTKTTNPELIPVDSSWKPAYNFSLPDSSGKFYRLSDFKGKVVVLDFWFTGCGACQWVRPLMAKVEKEYLNKPVVFISISVDKDKNIWKESLIGGKYTTEHSIKLYTESIGENSQVVSAYKVEETGFPTIDVIDVDNLIYKKSIDPRIDSSKNIRLLINSLLNNLRTGLKDF